jgi:centromere protein X
MFVAGLNCRKIVAILVLYQACSYSEFSLAEAVQRCAVIAEAEGTTIIEPTHLERVLPQLLLDF